jgi:ribosomal protein S18 acetylase RimI-like enzyme
LKPSYVIRPLAGADGAAYNSFLTAALRAHPDTLRIAVLDIASAPFITEPTPDATTFAAFAEGGAWMGVVSIEREQGREKRRHIAWVLRMAVAATFAGAGVGRALLQAAIDCARQMPGVTKLNLTVAEHNARAVHLYESEGFRIFSREPDAFRDPESRTELSMALELPRR